MPRDRCIGRARHAFSRTARTRPRPANPVELRPARGTRQSHGCRTIARVPCRLPVRADIPAIPLGLRPQERKTLLKLVSRALVAHAGSRGMTCSQPPSAIHQLRIAAVTVAPAEAEFLPVFRTGSRGWMRLLAPLVSNRTARVGVALLGLVLTAAVVGPLVAPGNGSILAMLKARDSPPSWAHPFGTTIQGLDVLTQVLRAAPLTLELVAGATAVALLIAVALGVAAGAFGGRVDSFVSWITGVCLAIPMLPLAIVIAAIVPKQQHTALATMLMIGLGSWPAEARVLRAQAMTLRNTDFVASATVVGESRTRVLFFEFVPNMASRIAAGAFFIAIQAMVALATLDFLASLSRGHFALGDTNGDTWGSVLALAQTQEALLTGSWWAFVFPALALLTLAAGLVLTMFGLEEIADPRLRRPGRTRRLGIRLPALRLPRLPQIELRSPLPPLRSTVAAAPYVGRRILRRAPIYVVALWVAVTIAYALPRVAARGGLPAVSPSGSFWGGYAHFVREVATGHLGLGVPGVGGVLSHSLPFSLALVGTATVLGFAIGGILGLLAAWRRGSVADGVGTTVTAVLWSTPAFALAGLAVEFPALRWHLFPLQWAYGIDLRPAWSWQFAASAFRHGELPLIVLVISSLGLWMLSVRTLTLGVVNEEYVQLARAKGLSPSRVLFRYAGRNALLPALTAFAVAFSLAIGGVPAIEEVFSYAGGGWELQQAAMAGNTPILQALFVAIALSVVAVNVLVDAAQVMLDPRLRQ
jgi:peptide/nickel transport system permease protein